MRSLLFMCIVALAAPTPALAQTVTCGDGTTSEAGRGACSHHGGVAKSRAPRQAEPKRETSPTKRETTKRDTSTTRADKGVRCSDGTYSSATGRGACSRHGGVADDLDRADTQRRDTQREPSGDRTDTSSTFVVRCADGTMSVGGRGACSHHGGIASSQARTESRDTRTTRTQRETKSDRPWWGDEGLREHEPMARCVDGTISYSKHHRGTCSNHGGVRDWLDD
jgi:hypothetical protein